MNWPTTWYDWVGFSALALFTVLPIALAVLIVRIERPTDLSMRLMATSLCIFAVSAFAGMLSALT